MAAELTIETAVLPPLSTQLTGVAGTSWVVGLLKPRLSVNGIVVYDGGAPPEWDPLPLVLVGVAVVVLFYFAYRGATR